MFGGSNSTLNNIKSEKMKNLIFVFAAMSISFVSTAQSVKTIKKEKLNDRMNNERTDVSKNCVMMMNEKMMTPKKGIMINDENKILVSKNYLRKENDRISKEGHSQKE